MKMEQSEVVQEQMQLLRSKAAELLLIKEWREAIQAYTNFITLCQSQISKAPQDSNPDADHISKLKKSLCLALSNRAEAQFHLKNQAQALQDCEESLQIEATHFKTLLCKGKILLNLNRYNAALDCFKKMALLDSQDVQNSETVSGYLEKCKKFEYLSRTGAFDISDWVVNNFKGNSPELAEYIGPIEIKKSEISGRGLFSKKNVDSGTLLLATKAIAAERGLLPSFNDENSGENAQLVMWKSFVDKVVECAKKCYRTHNLICKLSSSEDEEEGLEVPGVNLFRPGAEERTFSTESFDVGRIMSILDVNSLVEDSISAKVLGKNRDYYGVGLWLLASFINHSCNPNVRRMHIGDYLIIHASRDIKAGEELTFAYFNVLMPLSYRNEMADSWGFSCCCKRCNFEENLITKQVMGEIETSLQSGGIDSGGVVYKLEENMKRCMVRGKGKGYLRASFWAAYGAVYESEKLTRRWGRRIPAMEAVVDSVVDVVGSDEGILKVFLEGLKRSGGGDGGGIMEGMEKTMKFGRGIYGRIMKKQAMKTLLQLGICELQS